MSLELTTPFHWGHIRTPKQTKYINTQAKNAKLFVRVVWLYPLLRVTKMEFLLTISIHFQEYMWRDERKPQLWGIMSDFSSDSLRIRSEIRDSNSAVERDKKWYLDFGSNKVTDINLYLVPFRVEIIFDDVCPLFLTWSRINHITVKEMKKFTFQS